METPQLNLQGSQIPLLYVGSSATIIFVDVYGNSDVQASV